MCYLYVFIMQVFQCDVFSSSEGILRFEGCSNNLCHVLGAWSNWLRDKILFEPFLVEFYKPPDRVSSLLTVPNIANLIKLKIYVDWPMQPP